MKIDALLFGSDDIFLHAARQGGMQVYKHESTFDTTLEKQT